MTAETLHNEQSLLAEIAAGSESAFTEIFRHYKNKIYSIGLAITRSPETAEELVQDIFLKIWLKRTELLKIEDFNSYLFIITRNESWRALKKIARKHKADLEIRKTAGESVMDIEDHITDHEYTAVIQKAIDRLPPQQKQVYELIKQGGLKREEVALQLHIHPETVKTHLAQAMKNIRAYCVTQLDWYILLILFSSVQK